MLSGCGNNAGALTVIKRLESAFPRLRCRVDDCLKKCGPCKQGPFVLLDGELIAAPDSEELYRQVTARLGIK